MVFPTVRIPHGRPPQTPWRGGRALVVGPVNRGLDRTLPRLPRGAEQIRTTRRFQAGEGKGAHRSPAARHLGALAAPLTGGLAVRPAA